MEFSYIEYFDDFDDFFKELAKLCHRPLNQIERDVILIKYKEFIKKYKVSIDEPFRESFMLNDIIKNNCNIEIVFGFYLKDDPITYISIRIRK